MNFSTRIRVVLLVIAAALPALGISIYSGFERRTTAEAGAREDLERFAALVARQQEESLDGVRQILLALAGVADHFPGKSEECNRYFRRVVAASNGQYNAMGLLDVDGRLLCDAMPGAKNVNLGERRHFRLVAEHHRFAVGDYQIGRRNGLSSISFGYPAFDDHGRLSAVVFAGLNLDRLNEMVSTTPLPAGGTLTLFDHDGTIILRHPSGSGRIGEQARNPTVIGAIRAAKADTFEAPDPRGVERLYVYKPVGSNPDGSVPLHVLASIPRDLALEEANAALAQAAGGILIATLLLLAAAWFGAKTVILSRIENMLAVTRRVTGGDLTARTGYRASRDELDSLGAALDRMAAALQKRDAELKEALHELNEQATTDPLTGLHNRRYLTDFLENELLRARRSSKPVAVILMDVDHFKRFNDTWGHVAGDGALKRVAKIIREHVRGSDAACRYGGEEMAIILPEATPDAATRRAEAIRRGIESLQPGETGASADTITISLGIAVFPLHGDDAKTLLLAADEALYAAKGAGRNQVRVATRAAADHDVVQVGHNQPVTPAHAGVQSNNFTV